MQRLSLVLTCAMGLLLGGCGTSGAIFEHTVRPLDTTMNGNTQVFDEHGEGDMYHLTIPLGGMRLDFLWNSNAIGDIAKKHGMNEVHYADLETFNILQIWRTFTVHAYGR